MVGLRDLGATRRCPQARSTPPRKARETEGLCTTLAVVFAAPKQLSFPSGEEEHFCAEADGAKVLAQFCTQDGEQYSRRIPKM